MNRSFTSGLLVLCLVAMGCKETQNVADSKPNIDEVPSQIEGSWFADSTKAVFKNGELTFYEHGKPLEYPAGRFRILDDEFGALVLEDGAEEKFLYKISEDGLTLFFQRSGPITLTRE